MSKHEGCGPVSRQRVDRNLAALRSRGHKLWIFGAIPLILFGLIGAIVYFRNPNITVVGQITDADLAQIKHAVRSKLVESVLGRPSHRDWKRLPHLISQMSRHQISRIEVKSNIYVTAMFDEDKNVYKKWQGVVGYDLKKEGDGWRIAVEHLR